MLSFMLLLSGLFELFAVVVYERRHETREHTEALVKDLRDPTLDNAQKMVSLRKSGIFGGLLRSSFSLITLVVAAIFAFKATIAFLLPIWILSLLAEKFRWKENRTLFMLDNFLCAFLFFAAAWTVAAS